LLDLSSGGLSLDCLGEVRRHILLEVEVGELISLLQLEKSRKLGVRVDLATIVLVLELVGADVGVDLTGNIGAGHLGSLVLSKERSKLVRNLGGLDKARGRTVTSLALALGGLLLGSLDLTRPLLLKGLILSLQGGDENTQLLELGKELNRLVSKGGLGIGSNGGLGSSINSRGGNNRGGSGGDLFSLGLRCSLLGHLIILYTGIYFLSDLTQIIYIVTIIW